MTSEGGFEASGSLGDRKALHVIQSDPDAAEFAMTSEGGLEASGSLVDTQITVQFDGANDTTPIGLAKSESDFNYYLGDPSLHRSNVPGYETVAYENLNAGIDLHTFGRRVRSESGTRRRPRPGLEQLPRRKRERLWPWHRRRWERRRPGDRPDPFLRLGLRRLGYEPWRRIGRVCREAFE